MKTLSDAVKGRMNRLNYLFLKSKDLMRRRLGRGESFKNFNLWTWDARFPVIFGKGMVPLEILVENPFNVIGEHVDESY